MGAGAGVGAFIGSLVLGAAGGFAGAKVKQKFASDAADMQQFLEASSILSAKGNTGYFAQPEIQKKFKSLGLEASFLAFQAVASGDMTQAEREAVLAEMDLREKKAQTGTAISEAKGNLAQELLQRGG